MRKGFVDYLVVLIAFLSLAFHCIDAKDLTICHQISKFFPNLCQYSISKEKCPSLCSEGKRDTDQNLSCGKRSTFKRFRRIIGGRISQPGQWPWHISIRFNGSHVCGGSILSENIVITAAHCVDKSYSSDNHEDFTVVAGTNEHQLAYRTLNVSKIIKHPGYEYFLKDWADLFFVYVKHDISLLVLDGKLDVGMQNQDSVCLPDKLHPIPDNYQCFIVGFGMTAFKGNVSDTLRHTAIGLVPVETCNKPESFNNTVNSTMTLCGGDGTPSVSPCNYDSGGGLVCEKDGTWYLTGIISSGYKCGGENAYSLYTNVRQYKRWIAENLVKLDNTTNENVSNNTESSISKSSQIKGLSIFALCVISFFMSV